LWQSPERRIAIQYQQEQCTISIITSQQQHQQTDKHDGHQQHVEMLAHFQWGPNHSRRDVSVHFHTPSCVEYIHLE
jgi:hypothetical protein